MEQSLHSKSPLHSLKQQIIEKQTSVCHLISIFPREHSVLDELSRELGATGNAGMYKKKCVAEVLERTEIFAAPAILAAPSLRGAGKNG